MKIKNKVILLILIITSLTSSLSLASVDKKHLDTNLRSYLVGDYGSGRILEGNNIDDIVEIASISKLMSYMVVMDSGVDLQEKVLIDQDSLSIGGSMMKLEENKEYTVDKLLDYSLVVSSNNAVYALSKHISGSEERFVEKMNDKAREIGLETAKFYNSTGLPVKELDVQNIMSTRDIFEMSRYLIKNYPVLEKTNMETIVGLDYFGQEKVLKNTNPTLALGEVDGLKTGHTNKAGYCLVSTLYRGRQDRLIGVFMGATSEAKRSEITQDALIYINERYGREKLLFQDQSIGSVNIANSNKKDLPVFPVEDYWAVVDKTDGIKYEINLDEMPKFPIKKGEVLGQVKVINGKDLVGQVDLVAQKTVRKKNIFSRIFNDLGDFFRKISLM